MDTRSINHRHCALYRGESIRHLVSEIAQRTAQERVDDVVAEMHAQMVRPNRSLDVDMAAHRSRQYIACAECSRAITLDDVEFNQCAHCGAQILSK